MKSMNVCQSCGRLVAENYEPFTFGKTNNACNHRQKITVGRTSFFGLEVSMRTDMFMGFMSNRTAVSRRIKIPTALQDCLGGRSREFVLTVCICYIRCVAQFGIGTP